jgi:preprotein translocase subunit SecD
MKSRLKVKFALIVVMSVVLAVLAYPREDAILGRLGLKGASLQLRQGLDLQGGAHLVYQADLSKVAENERSRAVAGVVDVIQKRLNPGGTSEIVVQTSGSDKIIVELPGVHDLAQAIATIGRTAQLNFMELKGSAPGEPPAPTDLSGKDFQRADADIDVTTGQPLIRFEFKSDAAKRFADLTTRINAEGGRLVIMLDEQVLFNGTVSTPITDGKGQMQGFEDINAAKQTALLLNAGALPVPVDLVEQRTVGASLGQESVSRSVLAGIIGLAAVALFMILYYRAAGLLAVVALGIYAALVVVIFKLSALTPWTIVLTLAGVAGFILSIGEAVDANILVFERLREELRSGKNLLSALEAGFSRAWLSIRDSNMATIIICLILYQFGHPIIKGFAVTLIIGTLVSMFTAIAVTRTLMRVFARSRFGRNPRLYGVKPEEVIT